MARERNRNGKELRKEIEGETEGGGKEIKRKRWEKEKKRRSLERGSKK